MDEDRCRELLRMILSKVIREDKRVKDLLYAGAERGFYVSTTGESSGRNSN